MSVGSALQRVLVGLVGTSRRYAWAVVIAGVLFATGAGVYASRHLGVDTDTDQMFSASLPWRQREISFEREFPQYQGLLVAVIAVKAPEAAEATARDLAGALRSDHQHFDTVSRPGASPYLAQEGLLFLSKQDLARLLNRIIDAQPFLSTLTQDTTARGLFSALTTGTAFGSLALSAHAGTASMGELLLISLGCTLLTSLVFVPALLAALSGSSY